MNRNGSPLNFCCHALALLPWETDDCYIHFSDFSTHVALAGLSVPAVDSCHLSSLPPPARTTRLVVRTLLFVWLFEFQVSIEVFLSGLSQNVADLLQISSVIIVGRAHVNAHGVSATR